MGTQKTYQNSPQSMRSLHGSSNRAHRILNPRCMPVPATRPASKNNLVRPIHTYSADVCVCVYVYVYVYVCISTYTYTYIYIDIRHCEGLWGPLLTIHIGFIWRDSHRAGWVPPSGTVAVAIAKRDLGLAVTGPCDGCLSQNGQHVYCNPCIIPTLPFEL